jgi:energy-coupling factor transport system permease protein
MSPRCLAAWSAAALTMALVSTQPVYRLLTLLAALNVVLATAQPHRRLRPLLVATTIAMALAVVLNVLLSHTGDTDFAALPSSIPVFGGRLTLEATVYGADAAVGLAAAVLAVAPLNLALEPHDLVDALPRARQRTAMAAAAALNLVPGIGRSYVAVRDAQRMRGLPVRGVRALPDLLVPVALSAMEDSLQLAEAMEARAYGSGPRTHYRVRRVAAADVAVLLASMTALLITIGARVSGGDDDWYPYPTVTAPAVSALMLTACLLLLTPVMAWRRSRSAG